MTRPPRRPPLLIEDGHPDLADPAPSPADAPPPPDAPETPDGAAVRRAARLAAPPSKRSRAAAVFAAAAGAFVALALGVAAWDFAAGLISRNAVLGTVAAGLAVAAIAALLVVAAAEAAALARLNRIDALRDAAERALRQGDGPAARAVAERLDRLYAARPDLEWARARAVERRTEVLDADAILTLAERDYLTSLDAEARRAAETAARQVAAATALVPLALMDVAAALVVNLRMMRRIAEIYGGRAGALGSWRLLRAVAGHLIATGAIAAGDDLLGPILGGSALAKLSRRFGEGLVNGALTARIGVAAIEVCRPLPFAALPAPRARNIVARALGQFMERAPKAEAEKDDQRP